MRGKPPTSSGRIIDRERFTRVQGSPVRVAILEVLSLDGGRRLSATEIATELQTGLSWAIYHVQVLETLGFLKVSAEIVSSDSGERYYGLVDPSPNSAMPPG